MPPEIEALTAEFKEAVRRLYGERLDKLLLYGSFARGDFRDDSDVDFLILLKDTNVRPFAEITRMTPEATRLTLKYNRALSYQPVSSERFFSRNLPLFVHARNEGIEL